MKKVIENQSGFTLVEMVVVVLILSVLAVTAYAHMSQVDTQAKQATLQSLRAKIMSVATMARGVCMSDPQCDSNQNSPSALIEGHTIYFSHGYPVGWRSGEDGAGTLYQLVEADRFSVRATLSDTNRATYLLEGAKDINHCKVEYVIATDNNNPSGLSVNIDNTGC